MNVKKQSLEGHYLLPPVAIVFKDARKALTRQAKADRQREADGTRQEQN
jgi:hypothetical protein